MFCLLGLGGCYRWGVRIVLFFGGVGWVGWLVFGFGLLFVSGIFWFYIALNDPRPFCITLCWCLVCWLVVGCLVFCCMVLGCLGWVWFFVWIYWLVIVLFRGGDCLGGVGGVLG